MTLTLSDVSWLAVLVAGVASFLLGGLWYSPLLFAKAWIRLHGFTDEKVKELQAKARAAMFAVPVMTGIVTALGMSIFLAGVGGASVVDGLVVGGACWVFFAGAAGLTNHVFSYRPLALFAIDGGYQLVSFLLTGAILGGWR